MGWVACLARLGRLRRLISWPVGTVQTCDEGETAMFQKLS